MDSMEKFMLASINENKGALFGAKSILMYGLAGISLYELYRSNRLLFDARNVSTGNSSHTGNEILDEMMDYMAKSKDAHKVGALVMRFPHRIRRFSARLLEKLEDSGMIRIEQNRFLGLIPYNRYTITKRSEYKKLINEIRRVVLENDTNPDPQTALMITLLSTCNVLRHHFDKKERKQYRDTFRRIVKADLFKTLDGFGAEINKSVKRAIAAQAAAA